MADLFSHPDFESGNGFDQRGFNGEGTVGGRKAVSAGMRVPRMGRWRLTVRTENAKALFGQRRNLIPLLRKRRLLFIPA